MAQAISGVSVLGGLQQGKVRYAIILVIAIFASASLAFAEESRDSIARFLAGMPIAPSPLGTIANERWSRTSTALFNAAWFGLDRDEIPKIRSWSAIHLDGDYNVVFYMFSGPDFIYANAFFPRATTYLLVGTELVGAIPDIARLPEAARASALECIRAPFAHFQNYGFFVTAELRSAESRCEFGGNLPLLLLALAHTGATIKRVEFVRVDDNGVVLPRKPKDELAKNAAVKIEFESHEGKLRTLYYISTDLSNENAAVSGFLKFCEGLGEGVSLLKGASYLFHGSNFTQLRNFLLSNSTAVVEDDTGIPLKFFEADKWQLIPFGYYRTPIKPFSSYDQPDLRTLFDKNSSSPIDFGFGYRWRGQDANLLLAVRKKATPKP